MHGSASRDPHLGRRRASRLLPLGLALLAVLALAPPVMADGGHPLGGTLLQLALGTAALATLSAGLGVHLGSHWAREEAPLPAAVGVGLLLWLFLDLMEESSRLGRESLSPAYQLSLVAALLVGVLILAAAHRGGSRPGAWWLPALLWAVGVAFHTLGEGIVVGHEAARGTQLLSVPWTQSLSYALHKLFEGFTVGLLIPRRESYGRWWLALSLLAGLPAAAGGLLAPALGGGPSVYAFALGAGAILYPLVLLGRRGFVGLSPLPAALGLTAGLLAVYAAGIIHQY